MTRDQRYATHAFLDELLAASRERRPYEAERAREALLEYARAERNGTLSGRGLQ